MSLLFVLSLAGLIGIIASRIKEKFLKPTIVISSTNNIAKGACRSIFGFDIGLAILAAKQNGIVIKGGGHKMAAGFSVEENKISDLKNFLISKFFLELILQNIILYKYHNQLKQFQDYN